MTATETVLLPKLSDHWMPTESLARKKITMKHNNNLTKFNGFLKQNAELKHSPRKIGQLNKENSSFEIIKSIDRSNVNSQEPRIHTAAVHGKTRTMKHFDVKNTRTKQLKETRNIPDTKLCRNTYEKLKVCGVALYSKDIRKLQSTSEKQQQNQLPPPSQPYQPPLQQPQQKQHGKSTSTKDLIHPLLNSFYSENTQHQYYYRKNAQKPSATATWPSNTTDSSNSLHSPSPDITRSTMTIKEYLQKENARYESDEQVVKRTLFDNWLRNVQVDYVIYPTDEIISDSSSCD